MPAYQLGWLIAGYLIPYGISTLIYGVLSDWWGRARTLVALLCFATTTMLMVSFAGSWRTLVVARILSGVGCGGIVTISLAIVGDRYPYAVQGSPMGRMFGGDRSRYRVRLNTGPHSESTRRLEKRVSSTRLCVRPWRRFCVQKCLFRYQREQKAGFLSSRDSRVLNCPDHPARWPNHYVHLLQRGFPRWDLCLARSSADTAVSFARRRHRLGARRIWPTRSFLRGHDWEMGRPLWKAIRRPVRISLGGRVRFPIAPSQPAVHRVACHHRSVSRIRRDAPSNVEY